MTTHRCKYCGAVVRPREGTWTSNGWVCTFNACQHRHAQDAGYLARLAGKR